MVHKLIIIDEKDNSNGFLQKNSVKNKRTIKIEKTTFEKTMQFTLSYIFFENN